MEALAAEPLAIVPETRTPACLHAGAQVGAVALAIPHCGGLAPEALPGIMGARRRGSVKVMACSSSLLTANFNRLWCTALNARQTAGVTHFAMHHSDIAAPQGWIDDLLAILDERGADVVSAVVPMKDDRGLTTTGVRDMRTSHIRRLTMAEVHELPETFGLADVSDEPDTALMVNTGLWVCRFTEPWVEEFPGFQQGDNIVKDEDGRYRALTLSEDWWFSQWCHDRGLSVLATRAVAVKHYGRVAFPSDAVWGRWDTDQGDEPKG